MLTALLDKYATHLIVLRGLSLRSVADYQKRVSEFFAWLAADGRSTVVKTIGQDDVEAWLKHLYYEQHNATLTRHTKLGAVSGFWRFLLYEQHVATDITALIPRPRVKRRMMQYFTRNEVVAFFSACPVNTEKGIRDTCILIILAFAGLRVGELCGLRMSDIVDDGDYVDIMVPEDIGKQGNYRTVDLWKTPTAFLRRWIAIRFTQGARIDDPLFISYRRGNTAVGNKLSGKDIDRLIKTLGETAGIRKTRIHSHMFRATHGSDLLFIIGFTIAAIAARLGHKNIATTDSYLPRRGRITQRYRSLRDYWLPWEKIYTEGAAHAESRE